MTNSPPSHPGLADGPIYLDYNATTPVDPRVIEAMLPHLTVLFGNPSSSHPYADVPRDALRQAWGQVAALVGASPGEVVLTGSGSEANVLAIRGATVAAEPARTHVITQATEHPAVLETCRALQRLHGFRVTILPVDADGLLDPDLLAAAVGRETALVSVMAANNETGAIQPIAELAAITHQADALFHCDAAQAAGKIPLDVDALGVDLLTVVGHKMYAPKGVAALYIRDGVHLEPVVYGGGQEHGLRAGTENVAPRRRPRHRRRPRRRRTRQRHPRSNCCATRRPTPPPRRRTTGPGAPQWTHPAVPTQHAQCEHRRRPRPRGTRCRPQDRRIHRLRLP
jgi:cysteine desulfurase